MLTHLFQKSEELKEDREVRERAVAGQAAVSHQGGKAANQPQHMSPTKRLLPAFLSLPLEKIFFVYDPDETDH